MAAKSDSKGRDIHSRLSSSSESDTLTSDTGSSDSLESPAHIHRSARMRGRRHAVDHGRETPIPQEDLDNLVLRYHTAPSSEKSLKSTAATSSGPKTTASSSTRKTRTTCTAVSSRP